MADQVQIDWEGIKAKFGHIQPEAFEFVRQGLAHTVKSVHGDVPGDDETRNVSGQQLCLGLRDYAIKQYGMLAKTVLDRWGIQRTDDFGRIVFAMVDIGLMSKTEEDRMEDFRGVYDFEEAFARLDGSVN
ncbi:MAG TPA: Minf_1886 family protein [Phycisphaerales bacterium]|nr:Minf_1886 family protein [Phycisphaerales bacterium]